MEAHPQERTLRRFLSTLKKSGHEVTIGPQKTSEERHWFDIDIFPFPQKRGPATTEVSKLAWAIKGKGDYPAVQVQEGDIIQPRRIAIIHTQADALDALHKAMLRIKSELENKE